MFRINLAFNFQLELSSSQRATEVVIHISNNRGVVRQTWPCMSGKPAETRSNCDNVNWTSPGYTGLTECYGGWKDHEYHQLYRNRLTTGQNVKKENCINIVVSLS